MSTIQTQSNSDLFDWMCSEENNIIPSDGSGLTLGDCKTIISQSEVFSPIDPDVCIKERSWQDLLNDVKTNEYSEHISFLLKWLKESNNEC